ncbi:DUF2029 domain-containing protein [Corynebacterium sp. 4HC-13]|uniref:glycosyltransferase family 87 protein n=1 Tax=Corynebacterium anserum TaxID=2684406 RepID=UPI00163AA640|nr:glycosyltransferase family 87 protein [Corynebacterium anserum]MBC2682567.1 DUF2029 domain-containing protein [Corynebacterium anserum]
MPSRFSVDEQAAALGTYPRWLRLVQPFILIAGVIIGAIMVTRGVRHAETQYLLDVGVFQDAGRALLNGDPFYSDAFPTRSGFRFIYPPFAALLFVPLAWMDEETMEFVWTLCTYAAVFLVVWMGTKRMGLRGSFLWALGLAGCAFALEPIRSHVMYGQINIFLILFVTADVLGFTPRKIRGIGIGVAAGIKITPAAFALIFLVRKDYWSLLRSFLFFFLTAVIGFVVRVNDSVYFWTTEFFSSERGGPPPYPPNQSLTGLIARLGVDEHVALAIMKPGFVLIAVLCVWGAWRFERAGHPMHALVLVILGIVLAGPLAVTHHWAGIVLLLPLLFRPINRWVALFIVISLVAHFCGFHDVYPEGQPFYSFKFPQYFIGNAQGLTGLVLFIVLLCSAGRAKPVAKCDN